MDGYDGRLIAFEGIDGIGKTTLAYILQDYLQDKKHTAIVTSSISDNSTKYGKMIGDMLRRNDINETLDPLSEAMLIAAAIQDNWNNIIEPLLNEGKWVISDRYLDSIFAYQREAGVVNLDNIISMLDVREADLNFVLEIDINNPRIQVDKNNRLEARTQEWWEECQEVFKKRSLFNNSEIKHNYCVIDYDCSIFDAMDIVIEEVHKRFWI